MSITIKSVLERVVGTLEDDGSVTWTLQDLVRYLNDGQRYLHVLRPDLFNLTVDHALVAGSVQALPGDGSKLIDITHNTVDEMRAVTPVDKKMLDAQVPSWRSGKQSSEVVHFMYDPLRPKAFEVYPPAKLGARLSIQYAAIPTDIEEPSTGTALADLVGEVGVPDLQATALQHYICARCYSEGGEDGNAARAQAFYALLANELGIEIQATKNVAPSPTKT